MNYREKLKKILEELKSSDNPCWKGYTMLGTKKKNGKEVPNCVKESFQEAEMFQPPQGAVNNAKKAIKYKEEHGDEVTAMTRTGWTRARQLANGEKVSYDIVKRMSAFARHKKNSKVSDDNKSTPWKDNGYVAWLGWGGDAGVNWAKKIVEQKSKK